MITTTPSHVRPGAIPAQDARCPGWQTFLAVTFGLSVACSFAADAPPASKMPKGLIIAADSQSPDKRYGVTVFDNTEIEEPAAGADANTLVELKTKRVVAVLAGDPVRLRMNHASIMPARWSSDSSLLLWEADGKWFHHAMVLVRLEDGKLLWQRDAMKLLQQEILARTRKLEPKKYAKVKKDHAEWGSAYPDGFSVEVEALDPIALPLKIRATLASETKFPSILDTHLEGEINAKGELKVTKFASGPGPVKRSF